MAAVSRPLVLVEVTEAPVALGPYWFLPSAVESEALRWLSRSLEGPKKVLPALESTTGAV